MDPISPRVRDLVALLDSATRFLEAAEPALFALALVLEVALEILRR